MVVVYAPEGQQAQLFGAIPAELLPLPSSAQVALGWYANPTIDGDPSGVVTGVSVSGGSATVTYGPIAPLPIGTVRSMAIQTLNANAETYLSTILAPYPSSEALSWDQHLAEATAYSASPTAVTPL